MTLVQFFRLIRRHIFLIGSAGVILGSVVFLLYKDPVPTYTSNALVNTGLISGYSISKINSGRVDFAATTVEMENLVALGKSYEMSKELATRLMARYLLVGEPDSAIILPNHFEELMEEIPEDVRKEVVVKNSEERTYQNIIKKREAPKSNLIKDILFSDHDYFGIDQLQTMQIFRKGSSDAISISYTTMDPGICQQTLFLFIELFIEKQKEVKEAQSADVVDFFKRQTDVSAQTLRTKEDGLLAFRVGNNIINYYEQTRFIAAKKEDLDERYNIEFIKIAATDSTLEMLESQLKTRVNLKEIQNQLSDKRTELAKIQGLLTQAELAPVDSLSSYTEEDLTIWRERAEALQVELQDEAQRIVNVARTPEGTELKDLLFQWLNYSIEREQAKSTLEIMEQRKVEFEQIYKQYAPWGSTLKRIEREIDVAERAYLENLHSYNQALLHQNNLMMEGNLRVMDAPFLPSAPGGSKKIVFVVIAAIAGFVMTTGAAVAMEFLDSTLRHLVNASKVIELSAIGAFPKLPKKLERRGRIRYVKVKDRSVNQITQNLKLVTKREINTLGTKKIITISTREGEGKTYLNFIYADELRTQGYSVLVLYPESERPLKLRNAGFINIDHQDNQTYSFDKHFLKLNTFENVVSEAGVEGAFDFIFLELPGVLTSQVPVGLLGDAHMSLVVVRANRTWNAADKNALISLKKAVIHEPKLILNGVKADFLEFILGDIPKRRSIFRRAAKRIVTLNFRGRRGI